MAKTFVFLRVTLWTILFQQMRDSFHLDYRVGVEQPLHFEQSHRGIVSAEIGAIEFPERLQLRAIAVAVCDVNIEFDDVLQASARHLYHSFEIFENLLILREEVAWR